jgi:hypothetical protein
LPTADDGISFPVAKATPLGDHCRSFRDRPAGVPTLSVVIFTVTFPVYMPASQVFAELAALSLVRVNVQINRFVAYLPAALQFESLRYLLGTPLLFK